MKNNIVYFLTRSLFLGGAISLMFNESLTDTYISVLLGTLLGIIIVYIITHINITINNTNILFKIIYFLYLVYLIFILLNILSVFIYSYLLPNTYIIVSILPFILLVVLNSKSIKNILYVSNILFIISIFMLILNIVLLSNNINLSNILPVFDSETTNIFKSSLLYAIASTAPCLTLLGENNLKHSIKYYIISSISLFLVIFVTTLCLGNLVSIYSYPEYMVLRKIRFLNFIENIENFVSMTWLFDIFITLSMCSYKIKEVFNTKSNILVFIILFICVLLTNYFVSSNYYNTLIFYKSFPVVFSIFIFIILISLIIKCIKKKTR